MDARLIIVDGYNLILRSPRLKPGPNRTLRESRGMLLNLLAWMMGANDARFIVVFDGAEDGVHAEQGTPRVEIRWSRPPEKADDVIRHLVEKRVGGDEHVTVVTSDIEVARHARAEGADVSLADLFLASALGATAKAGESTGGEEGDEKPVSLSKKELEEWAEIFTRRKPGAPADGSAGPGPGSGTNS
jgi:predicted RNA-binding protein with PIN domain